MLLTLKVKNFAIIDNIEIDFNDKMTVLTGETGAGKSLIVDAISLLFGKKGANFLVREGELKAVVEGVFDVKDDELMIIKREVYANGKNVYKINDESYSLSEFENITTCIGDIHDQSDVSILVNPKKYTFFLNDENVISLLDNYQKSLKEYNFKNNEYKNLINTKTKNFERLDFLQYRIKELDLANFSVEEEEKLKENIKKINNLETIRSLLNNLIDLVDNQLIEGISDLNKQITQLIKYYEEFKDKDEKINDFYYLLKELLTNLKTHYRYLNISDDEVETIQNRLALYSEVKRKYNMTTIEIINYYQQIKEEVLKIENYDNLEIKLSKEVNILYTKTKDLALKISECRNKNAQELEKNIINHLYDLELNNVKFVVDIKISETFLKDGIDIVDFLISFNKGESIKPLAKIASGGELSRFMLALKCEKAKNLKFDLVVYDEIDKGVSGKVASSIAKKIKSISTYTQTICITHLPQVASLANNHIYVYKEVVNDKTLTRLKILNYEERIKEVAFMLSDGNISLNSINLAKELIKN